MVVWRSHNPAIQSPTTFLEGPMILTGIPFWAWDWNLESFVRNWFWILFGVLLGLKLGGAKSHHEHHHHSWLNTLKKIIGPWKLARRHFEDLNTPAIIQVQTSNPSRMEGPSDPCRAKSTKPRRPSRPKVYRADKLYWNHWTSLRFRLDKSVGSLFVGWNLRGPLLLEGFRNLTFTSVEIGSLSHYF